MLTGEPPFTGSTAQAIVAKMMTEKPIAPSRVRDTVPPGSRTRCSRHSPKLPADRFARPRSLRRPCASRKSHSIPDQYRQPSSAGCISSSMESPFRAAVGARDNFRRVGDRGLEPESSF
jgi:serine/threonine-protein kinase